MTSILTSPDLADGEQVELTDLKGGALGRKRIIGQSVPPDFASAEMHLAGNAVPTTMVVENTYYPIASSGWLSDLVPVGMTLNLAAGAITVQTPGRYWTIVTLSYTAPGFDTIAFQLFLNGAPLLSHSIITWTDTTSFPNAVTLSGIADLADGDVLDVRVASSTDPNVVITVTNANFSIK
jgi:hypothetical protein